MPAQRRELWAYAGSKFAASMRGMCRDVFQPVRALLSSTEAKWRPNAAKLPLLLAECSAKPLCIVVTRAER